MSMSNKPMTFIESTFNEVLVIVVFGLWLCFSKIRKIRETLTYVGRM